MEGPPEEEPCGWSVNLWIIVECIAVFGQTGHGQRFHRRQADFFQQSGTAESILAIVAAVIGNGE